MSDSISIDLASTETDFADVRSLCNQFLAWLRERYADEIWMIDRYYPDDLWKETLAELPTVHALPRGGIWLARKGTQAVGTVMLRPLGDHDVCEMKRLFVETRVRRSGVGRALCKRVIDEACARGYSKMRLDTGAFHDEAIGLYRSLGFAFCDAYYDLSPDMSSLIKFLEGDVQAIAASGCSEK